MGNHELLERIGEDEVPKSEIPRQKLDSGSFLNGFRYALGGRALMLAAYLMAGGAVLSSMGCERAKASIEEADRASRIKKELGELQSVFSYFKENGDGLANTEASEMASDPVAVESRFSSAGYEVKRGIAVLGRLKGMGFRIHPQLSSRLLEPIKAAQAKAPERGYIDGSCRSANKWIPRDVNEFLGVNVGMVRRRCAALNRVMDFFAQLDALRVAMADLEDASLATLTNNQFISEGIAEKLSGPGGAPFKLYVADLSEAGLAEMNPETKKRVDREDRIGMGCVDYDSSVRIQGLLADTGFYRGDIDGDCGDATRKAWIELSIFKGWISSVVHCRQELKKGSSVKIIKILEARQEESIKKIQAKLSKDGLYFGPVNGKMNHETHEAVGRIIDLAPGPW